MKKTERQNRILQRVHHASPEQMLATSELAEAFAVSETTIRRDFQVLADAGLILRQHGGAHPNRLSTPARLGQVGILLVSRIDKYRDPFYNMVLEGIDRALDRIGYHIAFVKTLYEIDSTARAQQLLENYTFKGLILLGMTYDESIVYLRQHVSPIVTMTDKHEMEDDLVMFDGVRGMRLMVRHLAKLGYRQLGYIAGYDDIRYNGFCQGLSENNLQLDRALHHIIEPGPSGWTPDLGERGCRMLMSQSKKPDAIVCASDRLAIGAMGWLQRHGYQVPADIAVTGFDNIPDAEFTFPPLTTVHVHKVRLGEIAAERLAKRIENPDELFLKITTPTSLVVRQSCGSERVKD